MNWFVFLLFFISGACGLIYEVVWSRMMQIIFGRSTLAVGVVLAAFMTGLTLGSYVIGKYSDKSRIPLRLYAYYEIGIGISALLVTFLISHLTPLYVWAHTIFGGSSLILAIIQFLIAFVPLIIPTVLMGATLPILSRIVITQLSKVESELGRLYAINTVGAVAGSLTAGFFFIKHFGIHGTIYFAVAGNLFVGVLAWFSTKRDSTSLHAASNFHPKDSIIVPPPLDAPTLQRFRIILFVFALSGFTSFSYEIFWTRSLVFLVGNTTYAFTLMLTAFLSGIALGGYGIRFIARRLMNPLRLFAIIEILIGIFSAVSLPLLFSIVQSRGINSFIDKMSGNLGFLALSDFGAALILMLIPATLIGTTFPLMGRIFLIDLKNTGTTVGKVYAVNTIGNVLGALIPGLLILPLMGVQKGILLMAALNICLGFVILISHLRLALGAIVAVSIIFAGTALGLARMQIDFKFPSEGLTDNDGVLYYREGSLVTTKVWDSTALDYKMISVDGINIGGTSDSDYKQQILAHLPKLLLKSYRSELTIGLGSGILAGESARHDALQKIVCVELARGVVEGAGYFSEENFNIVNDPRTTVVIDDITDFLNTTKGQFNIISADEKTAGKYATNSMSYSKDYYLLLRQHLAPGGLVIQWMPSDLPSSQYTLAMRTFLDAFPHVTLWYFPPVGRFNMSNTFLIGSNELIDIDPVWMRQVLERDSAPFQGIRKYGLTTADSILSHFIASEETLRRAIPKGPINTFEMPRYEFYSPHDYTVPEQERARANHEWLMSFRGQDFDKFVGKKDQTSDIDRLNAAFKAEGIFLNGYTLQLGGSSDLAVMQYYEQAINSASWDLNLRNEIIPFFYKQARVHLSQGNHLEAELFFRRMTKVYPESPEVHFDYGEMLRFMNKEQASILEMQKSLMLNPKYVPALRNLGLVYASHGMLDKAFEQWQKALAFNPNDVLTLIYVGRTLTEQKGDSNGIRYILKAYRLAPKNPAVIEGYTKAKTIFNFTSK